MVGIALREKPLEEGLTRTDILDLFDMLDDSEALPFEVEGNQSSVAMGFISMTTYDKLTEDICKNGINRLKKFVADILSDMSLESEDCVYWFEGVKIWLSR